MNNVQYIKNAASKAGDVIGKAILGVFVDKAFEGSALSLLAILIYLTSSISVPPLN